MTSEREQFGLALIEGMACGLPLRHALAGTGRDRRGLCKGWLVDPDDEDALVVALTEVVEDAHERERRGGAARLAARERFTWSSAAAQLCAVLEDVSRRAPIRLQSRPKAPTIRREPSSGMRSCASRH